MKHEINAADVDELKVGDYLEFGRGGRMSLRVTETNVVRHMHVDGEWKLTAGVHGVDHHGCTTRKSYEELADRDFTLRREASKLTDEQEQAVRQRHEVA